MVIFTRISKILDFYIFPSLSLSQVVSQDSYVAVSSFELSRVSFLKVQSDKVNRDRNQPGASKWLKNLP